MRLGAMYGAKWLDLWTGIPMEAVKAEWSRALTGVEPEAVRLAFEHIVTEGNPFPPTMPEFVGLVRRFRRVGVHRLLAIGDNRRDPPPGGFDTLRNVLKRAAPK